MEHQKKRAQNDRNQNNCRSQSFRSKKHTNRMLLLWAFFSYVICCCMSLWCHKKSKKQKHSFLVPKTRRNRVETKSLPQIVKMRNRKFFFFDRVEFAKRNPNLCCFFISSFFFVFYLTGYICSDHTIDRVIVCPYVRFLVLEWVPKMVLNWVLFEGRLDTRKIDRMLHTLFIYFFV